MLHVSLRPQLCWGRGDIPAPASLGRGHLPEGMNGLKRRCDRLESQIRKRMLQLKIDPKWLEQLRKNLAYLGKPAPVEKDAYKISLNYTTTVDSEQGSGSNQEPESEF